jgi:cell division protein FtsB
MSRNKPFVLQLIIVGGFLVFIYIFFALATSIYRDYKLEVNIEKFEDEIRELAEKAHQKPEDVKYFESEQYVDKYAKENMNLLNPGEKLIIIPQEEQVVRYEEIIVNPLDHKRVLKLPIRNQWWEYFFGSTLSLEVKPEPEELPPEEPIEEISEEEPVVEEVSTEEGPPGETPEETDPPT